MRTWYKNFFLCFIILILAGCGGRNQLAPVTESRWHPFARYQKTHVVHKGETLYALAFRHDMDFRQLARINHLKPPYTLRVGQVISFQGTSPKAVVKPRYKTSSPAKRPIVKARAIYSPLTSIFSSRWLWPVSGRVVTTFIPGQGKKGINIACKKGEKVHASSAGVVAYAGSGLRGYGNLIIIKHNNEFLTAYGNNARNLVSEGQRVKAGQIIAEVGVIDRQYWGVHFEIRKMGIPVNPLNYLQKG